MASDRRNSCSEFRKQTKTSLSTNKHMIGISKVNYIAPRGGLNGGLFIHPPHTCIQISNYRWQFLCQWRHSDHVYSVSTRKFVVRTQWSVEFISWVSGCFLHAHYMHMHMPQGHAHTPMAWCHSQARQHAATHAKPAIKIALSGK